MIITANHDGWGSEHEVRAGMILNVGTIYTSFGLLRMIRNSNSQNICTEKINKPDSSLRSHPEMLI